MAICAPRILCNSFWEHFNKGTQNEAKAITAQDYQVLRLMREMDYGHIVITVKGGQPVHAEVQKSVQIK